MPLAIINNQTVRQPTFKLAAQRTGNVFACGISLHLYEHNHISCALIKTIVNVFSRDDPGT